MEDEQRTVERQNVAREVGRLRSGVLLSAWAVSAMSEGMNLPDTTHQRFELYEGQSFVLELLAERLAEVYRHMNEA
jgi:hypothetical protein